MASSPDCSNADDIRQNAECLRLTIGAWISVITHARQLLPPSAFAHVDFGHFNNFHPKQGTLSSSELTDYHRHQHSNGFQPMHLSGQSILLLRKPSPTRPYVVHVGLVQMLSSITPKMLTQVITSHNNSDERQGACLTLALDDDAGKPVEVFHLTIRVHQNNPQGQKKNSSGINTDDPQQLRQPYEALVVLCNSVQALCCILGDPVKEAHLRLFIQTPISQPLGINYQDVVDGVPMSRKFERVVVFADLEISTIILVRTS